MAESYAQRLLDEVGDVTLFDIIRQVSKLIQKTNQPVEDKSFAQVNHEQRYTEEDFLQLINLRNWGARWHSVCASNPFSQISGHCNFQFHSRATTLPIIQMPSLGVDSIKQDVIYLLISQIILPSDVSFDRPAGFSLDIGGFNFCAVLVDSDRTFCPIRLQSVALNLMKNRSRAIATCRTYRTKSENILEYDSTVHKDNVNINSQTKRTQSANFNESQLQSINSILENIVYDCMKHVYIFSPRDLKSTLDCFKNIPNFLSNLNNHNSANRKFWGIIWTSGDTLAWGNDVKSGESDNDDGNESDNFPCNYQLYPHKIDSMLTPQQISNNETNNESPNHKTPISSKEFSELSVEIASVIRQLTSDYLCAAVITNTVYLQPNIFISESRILEASHEWMIRSRLPLGLRSIITTCLLLLPAESHDENFTCSVLDVRRKLIAVPLAHCPLSLKFAELDIYRQGKFGFQLFLPF